MLVPLATTALSLAGSAFGMGNSANANSKAESYLDSRMKDLESRFNNDYYQDFINTEEARSTIGRLNNQFAEIARNIKSSSAAGATAEAEIAEKDNLQKNYGDVLSQVAAMGTRYKQDARTRFDYNMMGLQNQKMGILQQKAASWDNFGANVGKAAEGVLSAYGMGAFGSGAGTLGDVADVAKEVV